MYAYQADDRYTISNAGVAFLTLHNPIQMTAMTPDDADALLVDGVCALEDYANEHQRACEKLKQVRLLYVCARALALTHN